MGFVVARHAQIPVVRPVKAARPSLIGLYRHDVVRVGADSTALLAPVPDAHGVGAGVGPPLLGAVEPALSLAALVLVLPARAVLARVVALPFARQLGRALGASAGAASRRHEAAATRA